MRILLLSALVGALIAFNAGAVMAQTAPSHPRPSAEEDDRRDRWEEWQRRTGTIWLARQPCQGVTNDEARTLETAQRAIDTCSEALHARVINRLDGRGELSALSSFGAIAGLAAGGTRTIETFGAIGLLPIYYEGLQSGRMTSIEFFAAHGVGWIRAQSTDLDNEFSALRRQRDALVVAVLMAEGASDAIARELDCVNAEISRAGSRNACASRAASAVAARTETRAQLERVLSEMQRANLETRRILRAADAELERQQQLPGWVQGRFHRLREIALAQQFVSRVGPEESFRTLLSAPFALVANTLRGTSTDELPVLRIQNNLQHQLNTLPEPLGVQTSTLAIGDITYDRAKISNAQRSIFVATQVASMQTMVDIARATNAAIVRLYEADRAPITVMTLPGTGG